MTAATASSPARSRPGMGAVTASYRLGLSAILTRGRIIGSIALIGLVLLQFSAVSPGDLDGGLTFTVLFFGIVVGILIPIFVVSTASNVLGAAVADSTLVYPWLRPAARWQLALGHIGAALTLNLPVAILSAAGGAAVLVRGIDYPGGAGQLILFTTLAAALSALAYTPVVTALGVKFKRASTLAFVYIFLIEQLFARNSTGIGRLSIQTYIRSAYFGLAEEEPTAAVGVVVSPGVAWVTLALVIALGTALTAYFLKKSDVA